MVKRVVPDLAVHDVARARDFYMGLFGFEVAMDMDWIVTLVSPSNPTAQVSLQKGQDATSPVLTLEVDDVDSVYLEAQRRGAEVVYPLQDEEWGVRRFFVRDPDGRVVNVMMHVH